MTRATSICCNCVYWYDYDKDKFYPQDTPINYRSPCGNPEVNGRMVAAGRPVDVAWNFGCVFFTYGSAR